MRNKEQSVKDTFDYKGENFIKDKISKEKLKKIEKIKTDMKLFENEEYMVLYASKKGIIVTKHDSIESAISVINMNNGYYRQLWIYIEEKGAYKYVAEYKNNRKIEL